MKEVIKVFAVCFGAGACAGAGVGMIEDIRNRRKEKKLEKALKKFADDLNGVVDKWTEEKAE